MHGKSTTTLRALAAAAMVLASGLWLAACSQDGAPMPTRGSAPAVRSPPPPPPPPPAAMPPVPAPPTARDGAVGGGRPPLRGAPPPAPDPSTASAGAQPPPSGGARPPGDAVREPAGAGRPAVRSLELPRSRGPGDCAADGLAPFPWPEPPQPSVIATLAPYLLAGPAGRRPATLHDVAGRLESAIAQAGYLQPRYLGAGCGGFAIVLDLERIEADGTRARGTAGFAPPGQDEGFSLAAYVRRLFHAPPGHYRQIVFVVSDQRPVRTTAPPTEAELRAIASGGASALPAPYTGLPYTPRHDVLALVYEFVKGPRDGDARLVPPQGRLGAAVHLRKAKLF